jgi:hypothetical protein
VKYELGSYIPEDGILHSHRRENLRSYDFRSFFTVALSDDTEEVCPFGVYVLNGTWCHNLPTQTHLTLQSQPAETGPFDSLVVAYITAKPGVSRR